ncbi:WXG100 family type VII secretion target [Streptomyces sp. NPDC058655]|uniref:WXG100 family type VII secretion target n=1 Tax=Streptomyces sp. NPDC058655 TaxID=3346577 RepID=UPI0036651718
MATDFEGYTHAQLHAMIASLSPEAVRTRATQLTEAAKAIKEIGQKLKDHKVEGWDGEAAVAFQEWVNKAGSATLVLSDFSATGGHWMTLAAQTMVEARNNMPAYSAAAEAKLKDALATSHEYRNDPDARQLGQEAHSKLSGDHARAVDALRSLSQSYEMSTTQMNRAEIPTFPPPPPVLMPKDVFGGEDVARSGGGGNPYGGGGSIGASHERSSGPGTVFFDEEAPVTGQPLQGGTPLPATGPTTTSLPGMSEREANMGLNHIATPPPMTPPGTNPAQGPLPTGPGGGHVTPAGFIPLPPIGGTTAPGGIGTFPGTRGPGGSGGKAGGAAGFTGLPPRDSGIVGGRPVASGGPHAGIPRGTVIGAEGSQVGRGMGMGGGTGGGVGGPHGGAAGTAAGRRLAMESGGVVGGRQAGTGARSVTGGQPFTQGASGLVRNNVSGIGGAGHAGGAGARTPGRRRDGQGGERPDYLAEDEETWQGNRRVVPPVID